MSDISILDTALAYIGNGWAPVPIPFRKKRPTIKAWEDLRITADDAGQYFNGAPQNIGIILGTPSDGLTDIDLDCPEALALAADFLPPTEAVFGRKSTPASHWLYRQPDITKATRLQDPAAKANGHKATLVEFRAGGDKGVQTVFPGSTHEDTGEPIEWFSKGEAAEVDSNYLFKCVRYLAAACLLARYWPEGSRHDAAMAFAGGMACAGQSIKLTEHIIKAACRVAGDDEIDDRVRVVQDTYANFEAGGETTGWPTLKDYMPSDKIVDKIQLWLDAKGNARRELPPDAPSQSLGAPCAGRLAKPPKVKTYPDIEVDKDGEVTDVFSTVGNFEHMLNHYGVKVRFNAMSKREEIIIPGEGYSMEASGDAPAAHIRGMVNRAKFANMPVDRFLEAVAAKPGNTYHPVRTWIDSRPWDGVSRIKAFCDCLQTQPGFDPALKLAYIRTWMIGAVAVLYAPDGVSVRFVPVIVGGQNLRKTRLMHSLVPKDNRGDWTYELEGMSPQNKDCVMNAITHWITELSEIEATFTRADISALKTFISRSVDQVRTAYSRREKIMPRRTVFWGTANSDRPLSDSTGNTRYGVIPVVSCNADHDIDTQQLWAEVKTLYDAGEKWWLSDDLVEQQSDANKQFEPVDPIEELIRQTFDCEAGPQHNNPYSASQALKACGFKA